MMKEHALTKLNELRIFEFDLYFVAIAIELVKDSANFRRYLLKRMNTQRIHCNNVHYNTREWL